MIRKLALLFSLIVALGSPALADTHAASRIVVLTRDIARGEVIADADLAFSTPTSPALMNGTITSMDALNGMEARRALKAGEPIQAYDVRRPIVVTRGQTITMSFDAPGVNLTAMGRAMSEGGVGDTVTVQNPVSFRMISAIVTSPGNVRAAGPIANGSAINNASAMNAPAQLTARR